MCKTVCQLLIVLNFCFLNFVPFSFSAEKKNPDRLFLLLGTPTPKRDAAMPASLYKISQNKNSLTKVRDLVSSERGTDFIHEYPERQLIILGEKRNYLSPRPHMKFIVLKTDDPLRELSFEIDFGCDCSSTEVPLFDIPHRGLFQGLRVAGRNEAKLFGMNLSSMKKREELPWDVYKYALASGRAGVELSSALTRFYLHHRQDGKLIIRRGGRLQTDWQLSGSAVFSKGDVISAYVSNNEMLALTSNASRMKKAEGLGFVDFHIFDKKAGNWHKVRFQGCMSEVRGAGPWLAGYVADKYRGAGSPGRERRRQEPTATGWPADWNFRDSEIYSPGILFLYNIHTRKKYTVKTSQGDNEVLLIEGGTVYYRANRSVYKAEIGRTKIEKAKLLVRDDLVPDIHWAFIGP